MEMKRRQRMRSVSAWEKAKNFDKETKGKRRKSLMSKKKVRNLIYNGGAKRKAAGKRAKSENKLQKAQSKKLAMPLKR